MKPSTLKNLVFSSATCGLLILTMAYCNFNVEEPEVEEDTEQFIDSFSAKTSDGAGCISAGNGSAALNSNDIRSLYSVGNRLWVATWGGGVSTIDTAGTITTYRAAGTGLDNDFCLKVAGGTTNAMAACFNGTSANYTLHHFNGATWSAAASYTPAAMPILDVDYSGNRFLAIQDERTDSFLSDTTVDESALYLWLDNGSHSVTLTDWSNDAAPNGVNITSQAFVNGKIDRDGDYIMVGYFSDTDPLTEHAPELQHPNKQYKHLAIERRFATDLTPKHENATANDILPTLFGQSWPNTVAVYPLAIGYRDKTISNPVEEVFAAAQSKFYRLEIQEYKNIVVGNVRTSDLSSGMPSMNVREIVYSQGAAWVATDSGIGVYTDSGTWETFNQNNNLPSNNIRSVAVFNNIIWVGTDQGLCKIVKK